MAAVSTVSAASTLPSPPMERKSPPSRATTKDGERSLDSSPKEQLSKMSEDRRSREAPSPAFSTADSPSAKGTQPKAQPGQQTPSADDYEKGLVLCDTCGEGVPFRDPQSGGFTLRLWDMHRDQCRSRHGPQSEPIVFTPETTVDSMANPPVKKRRAKRTEEERIEYLRTDPYVAQFEPYRVLCGSCNKWIRLRPNSTYCSIPWDAHRKSCLSKKAALPVEHRSADMAGAPAGRPSPSVATMTMRNMHMSTPNGQISTSGAPHTAAHRLHSSIAPASPMLSAKSRAPAPSLGSLPPPVPFPPRSSVGSPYATPTSMASGSYASGPDCSPPTLLRDLGPTTGTLALHDARRKNAEQRAAALKADPLIREVEPNRVFCGLCGKWVQLRQDSSFCAYPWHQHRSKCLARYERRQEKARIHAYATQHGGYEVSRHGAYSSHSSTHPNGDIDAEDSLDEDLDSDDDYPPPHHRSLEVDSGDEDSRRHPHAQSPPGYAWQRHEKPGSHPYARAPPPSSNSHSYPSSHANSSGRYKLSPQAASLASRHGQAASYVLRKAHTDAIEEQDDISMDEDADGDRDADMDMDEEEGENEHRYRVRYEYPRRVSREYSHSRSSQAHSTRRLASADLRSASGRLAFISASVEHLFKTTYDRGDELSVSALVNYLNAAMPADKHDDFDVQEVTRAIASLAKSGVLVLEGDRLRQRD